MINQPTVASKKRLKVMRLLSHTKAPQRSSDKSNNMNEGVRISENLEFKQIKFPGNTVSRNSKLVSVTKNTPARNTSEAKKLGLTSVNIGASPRKSKSPLKPRHKLLKSIDSS